MLNFLKKTDDNGSVNQITITEKEIKKVLFDNLDSKMLPKRHLINHLNKIDDDYVNFDYIEEEAYWLAAFLEYLNDAISEYSEEISKIADRNSDTFTDIRNFKNGVQIEPLYKTEVLDRLKEIVNNGPKKTDVYEKKELLSAVSGAVFFSNLLNITIGLFVVSYKDCNIYAKRYLK